MKRLLLAAAALIAAPQASALWAQTIAITGGTVAIGDSAEPGRELIFVRRDRAGAAQDLRVMAARARRRAPTARAALYFSCIARGPNLFPDPPGELDILRAMQLK